MALTIESLKSLFKKLGGSDSGFAGVNTIPEAIDKVTSVASSGGGADLPTPGTAGNVLTSTGDAWESAAPSAPLPAAGADGNVLTADDGEWVSAAPADNEFLVETTFEVPSMAVADADVPFADMVAAMNAGKTVKVMMKNETYGLCLVGYATNQYSSTAIMFISCGYDANQKLNTFYGYATSANGGSAIKFSFDAYEAILPPLVVGATESSNVVTLSGATIPEICAAASAGRSVWCDLSLGAYGKSRLALTGYNYSDEHNAIAMFGGINTDTTAMEYRVILCKLESDVEDNHLYVHTSTI